MAVLDFPDPPLTVGQQYLGANSVPYVWDGTVWALGTATAMAPSGPAGGDLAGTYPNPTIGPLKIVTGSIAALAVTDAKINDVVYSKVTGHPTSYPPSGAASGDLTGTYPGPTVAAATITAPKLSPAPVAGDVGKMVTVGAGPALTYTAVPTALPPSGAASGSLAGSYPGPSIAASAVRGTPSSGGTAREIQKASIWGGDDLIDLSVPDAKISGLAYTKLSGAPTALPPSGAAGGDLAGTYPNPTIGALKVVTGSLAAGAVTDAKVTDVAWGKITGAPSSLPPSGTAGGDLGGTYPNPVVDGINGAAVGTTTPLARGDLLVANATPALVRLARGTVNQVLQSDGTDVVWGPAPATGGPPTGAAGGSLTGSYPNPTLAASGVTAGTYGTQYKVAQVTVTAEGRITAVVEVTVRARWG